MIGDEQLRHAKRVIADQAIQIADLVETLQACREELLASKAALSTDISRALGQPATINGTVTMVREGQDV